jgi:hypothetical protein
MWLLEKFGWYVLVAALVCLWAFGQYWRGKKVYDRDRKSGVQEFLPKDK